MTTPPLNPGWLLSVLRARGLPQLPVETLRQAAAQLRPEQAATLRQACMALQAGTDSVAQMGCVADFVRCARPEHGAALRAAGLADDVGALLAAQEALGAQALFGALRALPDPEAVALLQPHLPPLEVPTPAGAPAGASFEDEEPTGEAMAPPAADEPPSWAPEAADGQAPWPAPPAAMAAGAAAPVARTAGAAAHEAAGPRSAAADGVETAPPRTAAPARTPPPAPAAAAPARVLPRGHHVYGAKAALRVEEDRWRTDDPVRCHTLRLEVAPALGERSYDWEHKIAVQLTARELPSFAAVLLNLLPQLQAQGHGPLNDKWLECRRQAGSVLVRVGQGRRGCAIPVGGGDLYELTLLALDALKANAPQADTAQVMAGLQALAG